MAVTHKAEVVTLGPDLIFAQVETTQEEVELIQRWVDYQAQRIAVRSQTLEILPLCADADGRLSDSGHEIAQLHVLLYWSGSTSPRPRINLYIKDRFGGTTSSGLFGPGNLTVDDIQWLRDITQSRIEAGLY